jgi:hypothetical protein
MKTALMFATAVAVTYFCEADTAKAKGPHGSHGASTRSNGNNFVRPMNYPTYTKQIFTQKPIVTTPLILVQKAEILPIKTADLKNHLHHRYHRHRHHGLDAPNVDISDSDLDDEDEDESCEMVEAVTGSNPTPSLSTGTPKDDDADDDDDDDDDD